MCYESSGEWGHQILQRNLYQTLQLIELEFPLVIALNLVDHAQKMGIKTDIKKLSKLLGVSVIPMVATKGEGIEELLEYVTNKVTTIPAKGQVVSDTPLGEAISKMEEAIERSYQEKAFGLSARALAIRLLENDPEFTELAASQDPVLLETAQKLGKSIEIEYGEPPKDERR